MCVCVKSGLDTSSRPSREAVGMAPALPVPEWKPPSASSTLVLKSLYLQTAHSCQRNVLACSRQVTPLTRSMRCSEWRPKPAGIYFLRAQCSLSQGLHSLAL